MLSSSTVFYTDEKNHPKIFVIYNATIMNIQILRRKRFLTFFLFLQVFTFFKKYSDTELPRQDTTNISQSILVNLQRPSGLTLLVYFTVLMGTWCLEPKDSQVATHAPSLITQEFKAANLVINVLTFANVVPCPHIQ